MCVCVCIYIVCACEFARTPPPRRHSNDDVIHYMYYILYSPRQLPFRCRATPPLPHRFTLYLYQLVPKSDSRFVCCRSLFSRNDIINIIIVTALYTYLHRCRIAAGFARDYVKKCICLRTIYYIFIYSWPLREHLKLKMYSRKHWLIKGRSSALKKVFVCKNDCEENVITFHRYLFVMLILT